MLNTTKLLYILPDLAYVAELLPGKKPHEFAIQSFRQINGEFIDDNQMIAPNVIKLMSKLEEGEYHLILPDYLFTNTIISVKETQDDKIAQYLQQTLLPQLGINTASHDVDTTVLTSFKNQSKVQLSALEKTLLAAARVGLKASKAQITAVSPLSWTMKALVSLEPSVTVLQIGTMLYSALHYIGVDQANQATTGEAENIAETIKTLKGVEANIQTVYLLTDDLVESRLKESLGKTLPLQQLTLSENSSDQLPAHVKQIIETTAKTLSISDYPVPKFPFTQATPQDELLLASPVELVEEEVQESEQDTNTESKMNRENVAVITAQPKKIKLESTSITTDISQATESPAKIVETVSVRSVTPQLVTAPIAAQVQTAYPSIENENKEKLMPETSPSPIIKNQSGAGSLVRLILVTLSVFIAVVAIGVGVGLGLLSLSDKEKSTPVVQPSVEVQAQVTPEPTPTPELPTVDISTMKIHVVNATTKAGYAGTIRTKLETAGVKSATAGNAKSTYSSTADGLVLMPKEDQSLVVALSEATGLKLEYAEGYLTEDAKSAYGAVIVLTK